MRVARNAAVSYADFRDWRESATAFDGLSAEAGGDMNLSDEGGAPERFRGTYCQRQHVSRAAHSADRRTRLSSPTTISPARLPS